MDFRQALTRAYLRSPGEVLPNALWKTLARLSSWETAFELDAGGEVCRLEAYNHQRLMLLWERAGCGAARLAKPPETLEFALLHDRDLERLPLAHFPRRTAYFRLIFTGEPAPPALPGGFQFRAVDIQHEIEAAAHLIRQCYPNIHPAPETVQSWTHHPVFSPELWVWAWDQDQDQPAGLGIAELDPSVGEGSLEWLQILPAYRSAGLGKALVNEMLNRLRGRCSFTSVSGQVDNATHPERLNRRCGFEGSDIWWVISG